MIKNPPANTGDANHAGSIPGSGRSPGVGNGNPLQYSCLENYIARGAWSTMGLQRVRHDWVHTHMHTCTTEHTHTLISFSDPFPLYVVTKYWVVFPVLYSKSLLDIYFIYILICMLISYPWSPHKETEEIGWSFVLPWTSVRLSEHSSQLWSLCEYVIILARQILQGQCSGSQNFLPKGHLHNFCPIPELTNCSYFF